MEVKNCKECGRLYNYIGGTKRLCPVCMGKLEDKFQEVKQFIEDNRSAPMNVVSQECDVSTKQLEQWIREERLTVDENSPLGVSCEKCGRSIKFGRLCDNCKKNLENVVSNLYKGEDIKRQPKTSDKSARMRFID